jgi:predicted ATP-grasp superfamily ATP-dependent carboligase
VDIADNSYIGMCQFSRYSNGFNKYVSHYVNEESFISDIEKICKRKSIKFIFPSHNETEIIARHKHRFSNELVSMIPDESHCRMFNNKSLAYEYVKELNISVPERLEYSNPDLITKLLNNKKMEKTVIKLLTGNSGKGVFYGKDAIHTQSIVKNLIEKFQLDETRYPQIEEYVSGEGYGCSVLYKNGKYIAHFTHRRLRDKISTGGTSTFREAASHEGIESAAKTIFSSLNWTGLAMCEFKVCPETGKFWFIEVNPRMWGSISLAIESGVEFPYLAWLSAVKGPDHAIEYHKTCLVSTKWSARWLLGDIFIIINKLFKLEFKSVWNIVFSEKADSYDDFFWDDPLVFFAEGLSYLKKALLQRSTNSYEDGMVG